jgi:hypothetical protein
MSRLLRVLLTGSTLAVAVMVSMAGPADAACHHFSVSATPNPVAEGKVLTVTVSRDAGVAPSNIDLSSIDETAKAGRDYAALNRTVSFTNEVQQSFPVAVTSHATSEPARTFRLHLSNPGGCAVNPNFVVDPDVRVTIQANGVSATTATTGPKSVATTIAGVRATTSPTTSVSTTASTKGPASSSEPSTTDSSTSSTSDLGQAQSASKHGDGGSAAVVGLAVLAAIVLVGGGFLLYRRRMS